MSRARACRSQRGTRRKRAHGVTAERRRTKRRGTGDEKSETPVVPRNRGTRLARTRGGKGRPAERIGQGKDVGNTEFRKQLNETGSDSGACEETPRACVLVVAPRHRQHRHLPIAQQQRLLAKKLRGHYNYYGITGNYEALVRFMREVVRVWLKWLARRSQRANVRWDYFQRILRRYPLPRPRIRRRSEQLKLSEPLG